jgi:hypothetical protein
VEWIAHRLVAVDERVRKQTAGQDSIEEQ